jgi:hypothetical protein
MSRAVQRVARAVALGGRQTGHQPQQSMWRVLLDPAGHPFCLTAVDTGVTSGHCGHGVRGVAVHVEDVQLAGCA